MTQEQQVVLILKGTISELPAEKRAKVDEAYAAIKAIEERFPDGEAIIALALRAAEIAQH